MRSASQKLVFPTMRVVNQSFHRLMSMMILLDVSSQTGVDSAVSSAAAGGAASGVVLVDTVCSSLIAMD